MHALVRDVISDMGLFDMRHITLDEVGRAVKNRREAMARARISFFGGCRRASAETCDISRRGGGG